MRLMKVPVPLRFVLLAPLLFVCGCHTSHPTASDLYNDRAALPGTLPFPVLTWRALTTSADRGQFTTSTLFGNDASVAAARSGQTSYPSGAVLGLVTWRQRDDPHWFGARIPDVPVSVEFVVFGAGQPMYRKFSGEPLSEQTSLAAAQRTTEIAAMKAIYLP